MTPMASHNKKLVIRLVSEAGIGAGSYRAV